MKQKKLEGLDLKPGTKISVLHQLMYFSSSSNYHIEIHEYLNAEPLFVGYIESSSDHLRKFSPATAASLQQCVQQLIDEVENHSAVSVAT